MLLWICAAQKIQHIQSFYLIIPLLLWRKYLREINTNFYFYACHGIELCSHRKIIKKHHPSIKETSQQMQSYLKGNKKNIKSMWTEDET